MSAVQNLPMRQKPCTWWRHQMESFSALLSLCAGISPVPGEFPAQRPVTRSFDVFFDLRPNKRLSKQSWGWWFETLPCSSWRHCNDLWYHSWSLHIHDLILTMDMGCCVASLYRWLSARLQCLKCVSNEDIAVLHLATDMLNYSKTWY